MEDVILFLLVRCSLPSGRAAYQISQISAVSTFGSKLPAVSLTYEFTANTATDSE